MTWKQKREQLIRNLPTLLDVLEDVSLHEEYLLLKESRLRWLLPTHYQEGMFLSVKNIDGRTFLLPIGMLPFTYYRGESEYHPSFKPSLYRPNMIPSKVFLERLRACELELVIKQHPMTDIFTNGTMVRYPDGSQQKVSFSVDSMALAQHYGISTELLDLTVNKWVAAFFACTKYVNDKYEPIETNNGYGVFYVYGVESQFEDMIPGNKHGFMEHKLRPVGLQPFSRPGEQGGYVLMMKRHENFNRLCTRKIKFRHDARIAKLVFNYANRSKKLFPESSLQAKTKAIKEIKVFSKAAYEMAVRHYFPRDPSEIIEGWMSEQHIVIQEHAVTRFTDDEKNMFLEQWPKMSSSFYKKIIMSNVFIDPTDNKEDGEIVE